MTRILGFGAAGLALLVVGAALLIYLSLDFFVARAIESEGTAALQTPVSVEGVDLALTESRAGLRGLEVANPEGYGSEPAFALGEIAVSIDPESLSGGPIRLPSIRITESRVRVELGERGFSNLERILERVRAPAEETSEGEASEPTRFSIDELRFDGGRIVLAREGKKDQSLELPEITLRELGGSEGATGGEIARVATEALLQRVVIAAASHELSEVLEEEIGKALGEATRDIFKGVFE